MGIGFRGWYPSAMLPPSHEASTFAKASEDEPEDRQDRVLNFCRTG